MIQLLLQRTHFGHQFVAVVVGQTGGDLGVTGQQRLGVSDTVTDVAEHGLGLVQHRLLRQQPNGDVRRRPRVPIRRRLQPSHHPQQRRFPRTVGADDTNLGARQERQSDVIEDHLLAAHDTGPVQLINPLHGHLLYGLFVVRRDHRRPPN